MIEMIEQRGREKEGEESIERRRGGERCERDGENGSRTIEVVGTIA